ncbi:MAG: hypothetical protein AAB131_17995, partial [Actinomycetota bacterium]
GSTFSVPDLPGTVVTPLAGQQLRVLVSFIDGVGSFETITSAATGPLGINFSAAASLGAVNFTGQAGNDVIVGSNFAETLQGVVGDDVISGLAGADTLNGGVGNDLLAGGAGNDTVNGGANTDTAVFDGALTNFSLSAAGGTITIRDTTGAEGTDTVTNTEFLRFTALGAPADMAVVLDVAGGNVVNGAAGTNGMQAVFGLAGADTLNGGGGRDILVGGAGADTVNGGAGNDFIFQISNTDGRDFIDGGADTDTYILTGDASAEIFTIFTRDAWDAVAGNNIASLNANTEIVITRNGVNNASIIAQLDNIEEININSLLTTANNGNNPTSPDGGTSVGDTITVIGDFTTTSLDYSTITVAGTNANDTIDITGLTSAHRVVFDSNGGTDTIVGQVREQDIFNGSGLNDLRDDALATFVPETFHGLTRFGAEDGLHALVTGFGRKMMLDVGVSGPDSLGAHVGQLTAFEPNHFSAGDNDLVEMLLGNDLSLLGGPLHPSRSAAG